VIEWSVVHLGSPSRALRLRRMARRLVAGETLDDACELASELNVQGKRATLGLLGEEVESAREARETAAESRRALEEIESRGLDAALSVKLSALGLALDEELCFTLLAALTTAAKAKGSEILIDMERSEQVDATLSLYRRLRSDGLDNVGLALQARLHRTLSDIEALAPLSPAISLCKGGYDAPPGEAISGRGRVRERFLKALSRLSDSASRIGISTHDSSLIADSRRLLELAGRRRGDFEIQMLLGIAPRLEAKLVDAGEPVRVYVPYGENWYPYVSRRMRRPGSY
jgi:proline dehydrogenase